ncbi:MAG: pyridoxamine 5'-phosphate oxidase family protein [Candidatus Kerfeldbacteria bacterium]|nr:pyridoxamine 5'-phosphate oxidase family protein [Candidatus Kerfeldbacteria bacterium]
MVLATCQGPTPWVAPLAYVVKDDYTFYWYSALEAIHSQHVASNPHVAVAIFDSTASSEEADGIQMSGLAEEVPPSALDSVLELYWRQSFPDEATRKVWMRPRSDFQSPAILRFYQFTPTRIYKLNTDNPQVDVRLEIDIEALRCLPPPRPL